MLIHLFYAEPPEVNAPSDSDSDSSDGEPLFAKRELVEQGDRVDRFICTKTRVERDLRPSVSAELKISQKTAKDAKKSIR